MRKACIALAAITLFLPLHASAQPSPDPVTYRLTGTRIALVQNIHIERDEEVTDAVVVVGGNVTIDGRVRDGVVVVGGDLHLSPTADVRGDVVLVGGQLTRDAGAQMSGAVNYISFGEWSRRNLGFFPVVRFGEAGRWLRLAGTAMRLSLLAVLMIAMLIVARAPVARVGRAVHGEPLRAFVIGLAAEIFFIPVLIAASIALIVTIIGIPFVAVLIPLAFAVAAFAFVLGFTAIACRVGEWIEDRLGWRPGNAFVASAIGALVLLGPTIVARVINLATPTFAPIGFLLVALSVTVEFLAWTTGFGAAIITGLGRWYTVPPPIVAPPSEPTITATAY